jgi:7,8-dihydropterin-6-yl-methyl-4-(beta-D-ribofuranosyl)aminobenzene 5'-phosphate synthase
VLNEDLYKVEKDTIGKVDGLTIYTLLEDYAGYETTFYGQHGVSFLLDVVTGNMRRRILFDAGQSGRPILYNMERMGLNPKEIDMIFLSHCHYDHTGGLVEVLKAIGRKVPVVAHPSIFRRNLVKEQNFRHVGIEVTKEEMEKYGSEWILDSQPRKLMEGITTTGEIPKEEKVDFEKEVTLGLYTIEDGMLIKDEILDDVSLAIQNEEGLIIVSGCSHAGIVSITKKSKQITGSPKVKAIIGGYHLIDAEDERIKKTVKSLKELEVKKIYTGHCTGLKAECEFMREFGGRFEKLHSGKIIIIV